MLIVNGYVNYDVTFHIQSFWKMELVLLGISNELLLCFQVNILNKIITIIIAITIVSC